MLLILAKVTVTLCKVAPSYAYRMPITLALYLNGYNMTALSYVKSGICIYGQIFVHMRAKSLSSCKKDMQNYRVIVKAFLDCLVGR